MQGDDEKVASIIGGLLREDSRGDSGVLVNARKHRVEEKACQSNSLGSQPRAEDQQLCTNKDQLR
jgi:hypothetical protein